MLRYISYDNDRVYLLFDDPWTIRQVDAPIESLDTAICKSLNQTSMPRLPLDNCGLESFVMEEALSDGATLDKMEEGEWREFVDSFTSRYLLEAERRFDLTTFFEENQGIPNPNVLEEHSTLTSDLRQYMCQNGEEFGLYQGVTYPDVMLSTKISQIYSSTAEFRRLRDVGPEIVRKTASKRVDLAINGSGLQLICIGVCTSNSKGALKRSRKKTNDRLLQAARFFDYNYDKTVDLVGVYLRVQPGFQDTRFKFQVYRQEFFYGKTSKSLIPTVSKDWNSINL